MSDKRGNDSKVCAKIVRVGARMDIASLVKASIEHTASKCNKSRSKHTTGYQGIASATDYQGVASADNPTAIAVAWGLQGRAKGVLGAHIVCAEWVADKLICAKMALVDGVTIKADTYYTLKNGEFVEAEKEV